MVTLHATNDSEDANHSGSPSGREGTTGKTPREWLGLRDLVEYADVSERTLRSWIYSPVDPLPASKVSGKVLVRKSDFDAYLQRYRIKPLDEVNVDSIVREVLKGAANGR
jgi:hypothetical protein